jgi:MFS family permease
VALFLAAIPAPLPVLLTLLVIAGLGMGPAQVFLLELIDRVSPAGSAVTAFASVVAIEGAFVGLGAYLAGRAADGGWAYAGLVVAGLAELVAVAIVVAVQPILNAKRQWAAESQESPTPTETSNGTSNA